MHYEKRGFYRFRRIRRAIAVDLPLIFYSVAHNIRAMMNTYLISAELSLSLLGVLMGLLMGVTLDYLWRKTGVSKYERRLEVFEHYHWGLALLILVETLAELNNVFPFFVGIGTLFILAEITQEHPFAIKSDHQLSSTVIGAILSILMILVLLRQ